MKQPERILMGVMNVPYVVIWSLKQWQSSGVHRRKQPQPCEIISSAKKKTVKSTYRAGVRKAANL